MTMEKHEGEKHEGHLGGVYDAKSPDEVARLYDSWSGSYDSDMSIAGYRHPAICLALLARYLPGGSAPLLDAGAGTGLLGEWLQIAGYPDIEALDISSGMLAVAGKKNVYSELHCLALGSDLPFADGAYAGVVCAGVFTTGHVGPEGMDELIRVCRPGGILVFTVKDTIWTGGFAARVSEHEKAGRIEFVEGTEPYVSMPGEAATTPSRCVVLRAV